MEGKTIISVGIDIGTSTTKFVVSHLKYAKVSNHFSLPRYEIVERNIVYESPMYSTPLKGKRDEIDLETLVGWLEDQYQKAGVDIRDVKSGAVIITGETATKKNAESILHYLAEKSGDFVVAIAGASLEALLAGKGSGAFSRSKEVKGIIANIDIGGGTANVVLFQRGKVLGTITYHVGGRLIELSQNGEITFISPSIQSWLDSKNYRLYINKKISFAEIQQIVQQMCNDMLDSLTGQQPIRSDDSLIHSTSFQVIPPIDEVMISGGIGRLLEEEAPKTIYDTAIYGDVGPLLAHEVVKAIEKCSLKLIKATQTSRATVIGAGMQSTEISGATIHVASSRLPIRNLPIMMIELDHHQINNRDYVYKQIKQAMMDWKQYIQEDQELPFAICMKGIFHCSYSVLKEIAKILFLLYERNFPNHSIIVVICEDDIAKAFGQLLVLQSKNKVDIISIDQVIVEQGDYIDIGETINQSMVPVVVKTLAFTKS
ncbi:ethanolamine utilization protein [Geobacillus thermoleovorans]|uniref:ethanolamine ammonia-lyase reactivating factor EutA n=1 Tax=Geobacillus TaxID=129337 RepID=UPI00078BFD86|nr:MULTISPECIES: ethanolamine ammonia-lyase reactivating factor EutA [Geobacillus]AMQ20801.1 ethanolamine utilization protein [Geobacillus sp. JS12]ODA15503.1 ethanolamine utilization protein [Geobacillus thermoleovorans]